MRGKGGVLNNGVDAVLSVVISMPRSWTCRLCACLERRIRKASGVT